MNRNLKQSFHPVNRLQILIGAVSLLIGALVYLTDRPPEVTYFVYHYIIMFSFHDSLPNMFGFFSNLIPDFIHVFAFILITAGIVSSGKRGYLLISLSWLLVDSAFELGQRYNSFLSGMIPDYFSGIPVFEAVEGYFRTGTFDPNDLIALLLGASLAYLVLLTTMEIKEFYVEQQ